MRRLSDVLKREYGEKVYKISLSSGCTCPNRDGRIAFGGCAFCSGQGSGDFAASLKPLDEQIEEAKALIRSKTNARKFIAYFQSFTNTYGDPEKLERLYTKALMRDDIEILSLGTRPDCLGPEIMQMLGRLNRIKPVWIEMGLQTARDDIADEMNRGYPLSTFTDAHRRLKDAGLTTVAHVIFGLPGESKEDMLGTVRYLAELDPPPDGIKIQMLHVMKGTALGERYGKEPFPLLTLDGYAGLVADACRIMPPETVLHRMTGDAPWALLIEPQWSRDKKRVLNTINRKLREAGISR
ncbi:MAG: TIGR01212 family radical SAM protein [Lachnospiraceae bacterium]|nr:TIGR01212 family radical SAM protein [Lachnospiraceae bacterium]